MTVTGTSCARAFGHQTIAGIGDQRRAGIADQRYRGGARDFFHDLRPYMIGIMIVIGQQRLFDAEGGQQFAADPRILTGDEIRAR